MPIVGILSVSVIRARHRRGDRLEDHRKTAGALECSRLLDDAPRFGRGAATRPVTPGEFRRLRRQSHVSHHRNAGVDDRADPRERAACALEFHGVRTGLLDQPDGIPQRLSLIEVIRPEGHSATTSARRTVRVTARVRINISSIVTGTVES